MSELKSLKTRLETKESELLQLKLELIERRINDLQQHNADLEFRLRLVEASRTRLETIAWLAFGGGAVSIINIIRSVLK